MFGQERHLHCRSRRVESLPFGHTTMFRFRRTHLCSNEWHKGAAGVIDPQQHCSSISLRSRLLTGVICLLAVTRLAGAAGRLPGDYYNEYHFKYETPHTRWAKPYAKGKVRVFIIAPTHAAREVTELAQRLDCEVGGETSLTSGSLGLTGTYISRIDGTSPAEKKQRALSKLRRPWDVYVLANFPITALPVEVQFEILKAVKFGAGLVLTYRRPAHKQMWRHALPGAAGIAREVPLAGLTFYRTTFLDRAKAESVGQSIGKLIAGFRIGKGRLVQIDYGVQSDVRIAGGFCLTPAELFTYRTVTEYDYHQSLVAKAILWAAKREPAVRFTGLPISGFRLTSNRSATPTTIEARNTGGEDVSGTLEASVRNEWGEPEFSERRAMAFHSGATRIQLDLPQLHGGAHFLDLRVVSGRGVEGWASAALIVDSPVKIQQVEASKLGFDRDEVCTGTVTLDKACPPGPWRLRVALLDNYGRRFAQRELPLRAGDKSVRFSLPLSHSVSLAGRVRATLMRGDAALDAMEGEFFVRQPEGDDFPALVWGNLPGIFGLYTGRQLHRAGFNAILHYYGTGLRGEGRRPVDIARQDFRAIPYAARIAWKDGLMANRWSDKRFANAPDERARLSAPYHPLVYSLGDENYLPDDAGTHESLHPAFAKFLQRRYAALDDLNASWGTKYATFEEAKCVDRISAKKHFARYHDMEAFRERLYALWHREWHDAIKRVDPRARVGAEGSVPGELELSVQGIEFWGPYRRPEQIALQRSLVPRTLVRGSWFGGYNHNRRDPTYLPRFLWSTVLDGNTLLEVYCSYTCENFYNTDLSFAYWMDWFLPDLREVTNGLGQLLARSDHLFDRVALYHSQASLHLSKCWAPFGPYDRAHRGALQMLEDLSFVPDYVTSRQVEKGVLREKKLDLLVLPHGAALSDKEAAEIGAYVRKGGAVLADVLPGMADERCRLRSSGALDRVFGARRPGAKVVPENAELTLALSDIGDPPSGAKLSVGRLDRGVQLAGARPLFAGAHGSSSILVHQVGAGRAVLLNFSLSQYDATVAPGRVSAWPALARALTKKLGVEPRWRVVGENGRPMPGCRVSTFRRGETTFVGVLAQRRRDDASDVHAVVRAPDPLHLFDLRAGQYLGESAQVSLDLRQTSATFLAAMPQGPRRLRVTQCQWQARPPGVLVRCALEGDGFPRTLPSVFRLNVFGPDRVERYHYARTLYPASPRAEALIPLALNDPQGAWRVRVRHVDTGLRDEATVRVPTQGGQP